ncbi:hypothetical protein [Roseateles sp.]|uniref:hypothetical protein n=1 Tax=Roseateles sp. TaxID=1971397 RepID=UPI002F4060E9
MKTIKLNQSRVALLLGIAALQGCSSPATTEAASDVIGPRVTFAWRDAKDDLHRVPDLGGSSTENLKISRFPGTVTRLGPFISTGRKCSGGESTCRLAVVLLTLRYQTKLEGNTWVLEGEAISSAQRSAEVRDEIGGQQRLKKSIPDDVPVVEDEPAKTVPFRWVVDAKKPLVLNGVVGSGFTLSAEN